MAGVQRSTTISMMDAKRAGRARARPVEQVEAKLRVLQSRVVVDARRQQHGAREAQAQCDGRDAAGARAITQEGAEGPDDRSGRLARIVAPPLHQESRLVALDDLCQPPRRQAHRSPILPR